MDIHREITPSLHLRFHIERDALWILEKMYCKIWLHQKTSSHVLGPSQCVLCTSDADDLNHLLWLCPFYIEVWRYFWQEFCLVFFSVLSSKKLLLIIPGDRLDSLAGWILGYFVVYGWKRIGECYSEESYWEDVWNVGFLNTSLWTQF